MLYCPYTKGFYFHEPTLSALQRLRFLYGGPLKVNSGHRSPLYNAHVSGKPRSAHLALALDIRLPDGPDPAFAELAEQAGFSSFGYYENFIHVDKRKDNRRWYGSKEAKRKWQSLDYEL